MKKTTGASIVVLALGLSSTAIAQDAANEKSSKGAVVVELEAPKYEDAAKGIVAGDLTYYQTGNKRTSSQRGKDAENFCNRIRYKFGSVLKYETVPMGAVEYDYLKRVICYD